MGKAESEPDTVPDPYLTTEDPKELLLDDFMALYMETTLVMPFVY